METYETVTSHPQRRHDRQKTNTKNERKSANASAKSKERHHNAQSQPNAVYFLLPKNTFYGQHIVDY